MGYFSVGLSVFRNSDLKGFIKLLIYSINCYSTEMDLYAFLLVQDH